MKNGYTYLKEKCLLERKYQNSIKLKETICHHTMTSLFYQFFTWQLKRLAQCSSADYISVLSENMWSIVTREVVHKHSSGFVSDTNEFFLPFWAKLSDSSDLTLLRLSWLATEAVWIDTSMRICRQKSICESEAE